jgi:integrase
LIGPKLPRERVLNDNEIRVLWKACEAIGYPYGPCFKMLLLTGQRRSEVSEAQWSEFNLTNKLWTIPPERFKSNATQLVPLSDPVLELLEQLTRWAWTGDFLFSASGGRKPINGFTKVKMRFDDILGFADWRTHDCGPD